jgi:glycosyltransferase involved in cell wall biosynthesis
MHRYEPHFPEVVSWGRFRMREKRFKSIAQTSTAILVDSEIGKQHVVESYNTLINKVFPLPYIPSINTEAKISDHDFFYKYKLPKKFFYYPAQFWKHKNHEGLLRAAASVMHIIPDLHIVFTGAKNHEFENIVLLTKELGMTNSVTFCGYVPDAEIPLFYKRARALVMPTFFGPTNIPPLEAMKHCCPIGISDVYGSKNQLQDAALYFDPKSLFSIAQALLKLWTDDELGDLLKNNATKVLAKLNQNKFAKRLQEILEQIV